MYKKYITISVSCYLKLSPLLCSSQYWCFLTSVKPALRKMSPWLPHVGSE